MLVCARASVCVFVRACVRAYVRACGVSVCVCVCARARVYALRIVSRDKILCFKTTLIIYCIYYKITLTPKDC